MKFLPLLLFSAFLLCPNFLSGQNCSGNTITEHPLSKTVCSGQSVTLNIVCSDPNATYQWRKNGENIIGAVSSSYVIQTAILGDAGNYDVLISLIGCPDQSSNAANLVVNEAPPPPYVGDRHAACGCESTTAKAQHRDAFFQPIPNLTFAWFDNSNHTGAALPSSVIDNISLCNRSASQTIYAFEYTNGCYSPPSAVSMTAFPLPTTTPKVFQNNTELPNFTTIRSCEPVVLRATPSVPNAGLAWYATSSRAQLLGTGTTYTATTSAPVFLFEEPQPNICTGTGGDVLMCYGVPKEITVIILPKPTVNLGADQVFCQTGENMTLTASITGGNPPFEYLWSNGATTPSINVSTPNDYAVTVTNADFFRCAASDTVNISNSMLTISLGTDKTICPNTTTTITPNILGGKAPFAFSWNNSQTASSVNVGAGTYQVTVTDANGCSRSDDIVITSANSLTVNAGADKIICSDASATLTATITGGTAPFAFLWSNAQNTPSVSVGIGTYKVTVTDASGCSASDEVILTGGSNLNAQIQQVNNRCNGASDGRIFITVLNGTPPFSYSIDNGNSWSPNSNYYNLSAGVYPVIVKASSGCTYSQTITIIETEAITFSTTTQLNCNGGSLKIDNVAGGNNTPHQYSINYGLTWQSSNIFSNLQPNTYNVRVRDAFGCASAIKQEIVTPPQAIDFTVNATNGMCGDGGTITIAQVTGGLAPYQYSKNGGNSWQTSPTYLNLNADTYNLKVRDANLCVSNSQFISITESRLTASIQQTNNRCFGGTDGSIFITIRSGTAPFSYSIDNGNKWFGAANFYNLAAGSFNVKVRDNAGCFFTKTITITQAPAINFSANTNPTSCNGIADGKITFDNVTGGSSNNYKYSIDFGATYRNNGNFKNMEAGTYHLRIQDASGCNSDIKPIEVQQPMPITFQAIVQNVTCGANANGIIGIQSVVGGTPQYKYSKNGGINYQNTNSFLLLPVGTYPIQVKDSKGCESPVKNIVVSKDCGTVGFVQQGRPTQKIPVVIYSIAPNPSDDYIRVEINSLKEFEQEFLFFDALGRQMCSHKRALEKGIQRIEFDISNLPQGVYQIITTGSYARNVPNRFVKN